MFEKMCDILHVLESPKHPDETVFFETLYTQCWLVVLEVSKLLQASLVRHVDQDDPQFSEDPSLKLPDVFSPPNPVQFDRFWIDPQLFLVEFSRMFQCRKATSADEKTINNKKCPQSPWIPPRGLAGGRHGLVRALHGCRYLRVSPLAVAGYPAGSRAVQDTVIGSFMTLGS